MTPSRYITIFSFLIVSFITSTSFAKSDHPLLPSYPNANVRSFQKMDYERITIAVAPNDDASAKDGFAKEVFIGDVTHHFYRIKNTSTLKVFENYKAALQKAGFKTLWHCNNDQCGTKKQVRALGAQTSVEDNVYNYYNNPYYLLAQTKGKNGNITVALFLGSYNDETALQQVVIEEQPLNDQLIQINTSYLEQPSEQSVVTITAAQQAEDHPLISRYPSAKVRSKQKADYETIAMPFSSASEDPEFKTQKLTGDLTRHFYRIKNASTLKVYKNYEKALSDLGFKTLYQCELEKCGDSKQTRQLGGMISVEGNVYNYYSKPYFIAAEKTDSPQKVNIFLFIGGYLDEVSVQQVVVESEQLIDNMITVDAEGLNQQLEQLGKALIYGIHFDIDKASIKPESKPTLDEIAKLLSINKNLLLYVVGHTDDTGALDHNIQLSAARANAVKNALVQDYGVAEQRLIARGVGPFAPESNNTSNAGKQKNRRVELVRRLKP